MHFRQNDQSLLRAIAVARGVERTTNKSQHTKLTLEKKISPPFLPGFELVTFQSRVRHSLTGIPIMKERSLSQTALQLRYRLSDTHTRNNITVDLSYYIATLSYGVRAAPVYNRMH